jgi:phosphatidylserine/phosphatidylglycerophosphate/cardiolipin synthase-like enzyme
VACGPYDHRLPSTPAAETDTPLRLVQDGAHYAEVIGAVRAARVSVWIATANLKQMLVEHGRARRYVSVLSVLDELAGRGVELRLLHAAMPSRPFRDSFDEYPRLCAGALAIRMCPRVHLKTVIVDGARMYLGSANWTGAGLGAKGPTRRNFEIGVMTSDPHLLDEVQATYDRIWRGAHCGDCGRRDTCEAPLDLPEPSGRASTIVRLRPPS